MTYGSENIKVSYSVELSIPPQALGPGGIEELQKLMAGFNGSCPPAPLSQPAPFSLPPGHQRSLPQAIPQRQLALPAAVPIPAPQPPRAMQPVRSLPPQPIRDRPPVKQPVCQATPLSQQVMGILCLLGQKPARQLAMLGMMAGVVISGVVWKEKILAIAATPAEGKTEQVKVEAEPVPEPTAEKATEAGVVMPERLIDLFQSKQ